MSTNQYQEAWITSAPGRKTDMDGDASFDCVDVPKDYAEHIWANTTWRQVWPGAGNACDMIRTVSTSYFDVILNDPNNTSQIPQRGDVIVFAGTGGAGTLNPYGHIAVVTAADQSGVNVIQQDTYMQEAMTAGRLAYTNAGTGPCSGWLRPKFDDSPAPATGPATRTVTNDVAYARVSPWSSASPAPGYPDGIAKGAPISVVGYVKGEDPYKSGDNAWYKTVSGFYIWANSAGNNITGLAYLGDMSGQVPAAPAPTPAPAPAPAPAASTTRTVGSSSLNVRNSPFIIGSQVAQVAAGSNVTVKGYTHGDSVNGNDVWYEIDKGWIWSGGVTSQDVTGITQIPTPTRPSEPQYTGLNGIDISGAQKGIDLTKVDAAFVIIKATEGVGWTDPEFQNNLASARKAGKKVGFYHFARPLAQSGNTAQAESDTFVAAVKPLLQPGDFLALDWEAENQQDVAWAKEWLDRVYAATTVRPLFYADLEVVNDYDWSSVSGTYGLWLAQYPTSSAQGYGPLAAHGVYTGNWKLVIWQYSSKGSLAGWTGDLDLDIFFGTEADLAAIGYTVTAPAPAPVTPAPTPTPVPAPAPTPAPSTPDASTIKSVLSSFFGWVTDQFIASR